jgi:hypothetical protein
MTGLERCDAEVRETERLLRAGHPDVQKLFRGLLDWRMELPRRQQHRNLDTCYGKCAHDHKVHLNRIRIVHREWNVTFP